MRLVVTLVVVALSIPALAAWASSGDVAVPRKCTLADTRERAILQTAIDPTSGGPAYMRFCGPAHAVVRVRGVSYAINGGSCGHAYSQTRWVYFGLITNGANAGAKGLSRVLHPANKDGRADIVDSIVQVAGLNLAPRGIAVQSNQLKAGTFSGIWDGTHVRGSWRCEAGAFGDVRAKHVSG